MQVELRRDDIATIVNTLVFDGRVDEISAVDDESESRYQTAVLAVPSTSAFTTIPCGVCPVFHDCHDDGLISPATCEYYNSWLEQF